VQPPVDLPAHDPRHAKLFADFPAGPDDERHAAAGRTSSIATRGTRIWPDSSSKQLQGIPLVLTTHSLEPHRPWKVEQLGTAYHVSSWVERTAYQNADGVVAVSAGDEAGRARSVRRVPTIAFA
jgi:hypothetical protein